MRKSAKIDEFGLPKTFQNPSKMQSKSGFQITCNFSLLFARFFHFLHLRILENMQFSLVKSMIFEVFAKIILLHFACVFGPKNLPKILPKRLPNPFKIDVKNMSFFNIDFFGFRPRFWRVLGLQLGAKLAILASKLYGACPL